MNGAAWVGELLDRAVHRVGRRFVAVVWPFVVVEAVAELLEEAPPSWLTVVVLMTFFAILRTQARVMAIRRSAAPLERRTRRALASRFLVTLPFALVSMLEYTPPFITAGLVIAIMTLSGGLGSGPYAFLPGALRPIEAAAGAGAFVLLIGVMALSLLVPFAGAAALVETVLVGTPAYRSLGRWLREAFRPRNLSTTLFAGFCFALLVNGVALLVGGIQFGFIRAHLALHIPPWVYAVASGLLGGIADASAFFFAWCWRDASLDRRRGRDLQAELDASATSVSPTLTTPGTTTSQ